MSPNKKNRPHWGVVQLSAADLGERRSLPLAADVVDWLNIPRRSRRRDELIALIEPLNREEQSKARRRLKRSDLSELSGLVRVFARFKMFPLSVQPSKSGSGWSVYASTRRADPVTGA